MRRRTFLSALPAGALMAGAASAQQAPNAAVFGSWRVALAALDWSRPPVATLVIGTAD